MAKVPGIYAYVDKERGLGWMFIHPKQGKEAALP
jgi:hypothetical protein